MITPTRIGLVGLVLLSSSLVNAGPKNTGDICDSGDTCASNGRCLTRCCHPDLKQPDNVAECNSQGKIEKCKPGHTNTRQNGCTVELRCGSNFINSFGQPAKCNPQSEHSYCCNAWGWCGEGEANCDCPTCKDYRKKDEDDNNNDDDKYNTNDRGEDETDSADTSDCHDKICIDFTSGNQDHPAFQNMKEIYRYNTKFVKDKAKNNRYLYKSEDSSGKHKFAMWWKNGIWMVGEYDKKNTYKAWAYATSSEACPEEINYDWMYYYKWEKVFKPADKGMSVYHNC